jgi:hypothetical protein
MSSQVVPWFRILTAGILQLHRPSLLFTDSLTILSVLHLTNWVPGWRPFHTNLLVFSSQADFQLAAFRAGVLITLTPWHEPAENAVSNSSSIAACLFIAAGSILQNRSVAAVVYSGSIILALRWHVTIYIYIYSATSAPRQFATCL